MPWGISLVFLLSFLSHWIFCGYLQSFFLHCHWPRQSCLSHAKAPSSLWHGFSSSHLQSFLNFTFLPSGRHLLFPSTRWENLLTLLLPSSLSLSPPASQSFLNASFYPGYSSFWNLIPFSPRQASFCPGRSYSRTNSVPFSVHFGWF